MEVVNYIDVKTKRCIGVEFIDSPNVAQFDSAGYSYLSMREWLGGGALDLKVRPKATVSDILGYKPMIVRTERKSPILPRNYQDWIRR